MLPLLHAISGCDTNSFVFGKGKRAFMKAISELKMESELAPLSRGIKDDSSQEVIDRVNVMATKIFVRLYAKDKEFETLNSLRAHVYYGGHTYLEALPPTDDASQNHVRAVFQTYIWVSDLEPVPEVLDPFKFGWTCETGSTKPILLQNRTTPENLVTDTYCKCKKKCIRNCPCKRIEMQCDIACSFRGQASRCERIRLETDALEM